MTRRRIWRAAGGAIALLLLPAAGSGAESTQASAAGGTSVQANAASFEARISANGRSVCFLSGASNLVRGDTNRKSDIFVHDLDTGQTERVNLSSAGTQGRGTVSGNDACAISGDGRFVMFASDGSDLVEGDTNQAFDAFVRDRATGATTRVSIDSAGRQANGQSWASSISANGRFVTFTSLATNLVDGDTNGTYDVFVHDRQTGATGRVSHSNVGLPLGSGNPARISDDGRFVAFPSSASDLVPGDRNRVVDHFVHDRQTGETTRVSVSSTGEEANSHNDGGGPAMSADGRIVIFGSFAWNLVPQDTNSTSDVFIHDRATGETTRITDRGLQNRSGAYPSSISGNGRHVGFNFTYLDAGYQAMAYDRETGEITVVSVNSEGEHGNEGSGEVTFSYDGRFAAFTSSATNLVPRDTNNASDVFVHDRQTGSTIRASIGNPGPSCRAPKVIGLTVSKARSRLTRANCVLGHKRSAWSSRPRGRVIRQSPRAGAMLSPRGSVNVVVSRGRRR